MSYHRDERVSVKMLHGEGPAAGLGNIRAREDRGDGTGLCAVGTQYPNSADWLAVGPGEVDCLLCAQSTGDDRGTSAPRRPRAVKPDPRIAMSLDERIAQRKATRQENA